MGCGPSKPPEAAKPVANSANGSDGKPGTLLQRAQTETLALGSPKEKEGGGYVPGDGGARPVRRQRSSSFDATQTFNSDLSSFKNSFNAGDSSARQSSSRFDSQASRRSRQGAGRSASLSIAEGAMRIHGYVVAKDTTAGRKAGRVAVTAEGNNELRTQLARHQGKAITFSNEESAMVLDLISNHFLFRNMTNEQQERCLTHFERRKLEHGDELTRQGDEGAREFFIVAEGSLQVSVTKTGDEKPTVVASVRSAWPALRMCGDTCRARVLSPHPLPQRAIPAALAPAVLFALCLRSPIGRGLHGARRCTVDVVCALRGGGGGGGGGS
jgi:hypothetical protein